MNNALPTITWPCQAVIRSLLGALLLGLALSAQAAPGDTFAEVQVTVGSQPAQTASFDAVTQVATLFFDVGNDPLVKPLASGQSVNLPVNAQVVNASAGTSCACTPNELTAQARYAAPASPSAVMAVPALGEWALLALGAALLALGVRSQRGRQGLKLLATAALGLALVQPADVLHAQSTNVLLTVTTEQTGTQVKVTVTRNAECAGQLPLTPTISPASQRRVGSWPDPRYSIWYTTLPKASTDNGSDPASTYQYSVSLSGTYAASRSFDSATQLLTGSLPYCDLGPGPFPPPMAEYPSAVPQPGTYTITHQVGQKSCSQNVQMVCAGWEPP